MMNFIFPTTKRSKLISEIVLVLLFSAPLFLILVFLDDAYISKNLLFGSLGLGLILANVFALYMVKRAKSLIANKLYGKPKFHIGNILGYWLIGLISITNLVVVTWGGLQISQNQSVQSANFEVGDLIYKKPTKKSSFGAPSCMYFAEVKNLIQGRSYAKVCVDQALYQRLKIGDTVRVEGLFAPDIIFVTAVRQ